MPAEAAVTAAKISGAITFENFAGMRAEGESFINQSGPNLEIDLGAIDHANSLAVGAMVAWFRHAQQHEKKVRFVNVSDSLRKIIRVSGLSQILLPEAS